MITQTALNTYVKETGGRAASLLEACTRCGMCAEACHFYQGTGNPEYAPVWKIELLRSTGARSFTMHVPYAINAQWFVRWASNWAT
jgi:ferredoxin